MIERESYERFCRLRAELISALVKRGKEQNCKEDGVFKITLTFPEVNHDLTENSEPSEYEIGLTLRLDDDDPHARWWGRSFAQALSKCEEDVNRLIETLERRANGNE